jgi:hypothetical protein
LPPNPRRSFDGVRTAAEPEVVASVGAQVAGVAPSAVQATKKATGTKKAPAVDSRTKASITRAVFTIWATFGTIYYHLGTVSYHLGMVFTICGPRLSEETCELPDDRRKQLSL